MAASLAARTFATDTLPARFWCDLGNDLKQTYFFAADHGGRHRVRRLSALTAGKVLGAARGDEHGAVLAQSAASFRTACSGLRLVHRSPIDAVLQYIPEPVHLVFPPTCGAILYDCPCLSTAASRRHGQPKSPTPAYGHKRGVLFHTRPAPTLPSTSGKPVTAALTGARRIGNHKRYRKMASKWHGSQNGEKESATFVSSEL